MMAAGGFNEFHVFHNMLWNQLHEMEEKAQQMDIPRID